jgi:serine/threonine protein phosphatase PrpC
MRQTDLIIAQGDYSGKYASTREKHVVVKTEPDRVMLAVASGLGPNPDSQLASELAISTLTEMFKTDIAQPLSDIMQRAFHAANSKILDQTKDTGVACSTVAVNELHLSLCVIGDAKVFLIRDRIIQQISVSHSLMHEFIDKGLITVEDLRKHPYRDTLTRALGAEDICQPDTRIRLRAGDEQIEEYQSIQLLPHDKVLLLSHGALPETLLEDYYGAFHLDVFIGELSPQMLVNAFIKARTEMGWPHDFRIILAEVPEMKVQ